MESEWTLRVRGWRGSMYGGTEARCILIWRLSCQCLLSPPGPMSFPREDASLLLGEA